jgi:DNA-directed RNA polymerase specialized sigma24 family protein
MNHESDNTQDPISNADLTCAVNDPPQDLNDLVADAARGDRRAIGAIAIAFGPVLLKIAREELRSEEDAEDLVQDVYALLLEGRAANFLPRKGRGLSWLRGLVRATARTQRREKRSRDVDR